MKLGDLPAFPTEAHVKNDKGYVNKQQVPGMTLRQYYAGLAMQAEISRRDQTNISGEYAAKYAIACADALLAELEK